RRRGGRDIGAGRGPGGLRRCRRRTRSRADGARRGREAGVPTAAGAAVALARPARGTLTSSALRRPFLTYAVGAAARRCAAVVPATTRVREVRVYSPLVSSRPMPAGRRNRTDRENSCPPFNS